MDETKLVQNLVAKSEPTFQYLVETYQKQILNTCLGFVPNIHDAEDITQEVFIEVYRSIEQFKQDSKLSTWMYRIAVSKSLEHIRYKKSQKRKAFFKSLIGLDEKESMLQVDKFNHPGIELENKERAKVLYEHIDKLSTNQRIAFTLHKVEGLSHQEISKIMDNSIGAVESLIFRAKGNLKKSLKIYYEKKMI